MEKVDHLFLRNSWKITRLCNRTLFPILVALYVLTHSAPIAVEVWQMNYFFSIVGLWGLSLFANLYFKKSLFKRGIMFDI